VGTKTSSRSQCIYIAFALKYICKGKGGKFQKRRGELWDYGRVSSEIGRGLLKEDGGKEIGRVRSDSSAARTALPGGPGNSRT